MIANPMSLQEFIQEVYMKPLNLTQEALAAATGLSVDSVHGLLTGAPLTAEANDKLAEHLNLSKDYLLHIQERCFKSMDGL